MSLFAILQNSAYSKIGIDDVGMIAYFNGKCPEGWRLYSELSGRFPLASGQFIGQRLDGTAESNDYSNGALGGEMHHALSIEEIPKHDHRNGKYKYLLMSDSQYTVRKTDNSAGEPNLATQREIAPVGGDKEHNNMPPYLVLTACQKISPSKGMNDLRQENIKLVARLDMLERIVSQSFGQGKHSDL